MKDESGFAHVQLEDLLRRGTDRDRFDERPEAMARWLAELPLASIGETGRRVHKALDTLHGIGLAPKERLQTLCQLEGIVTYLLQGLRRLYLHQPTPLPKRAATAARLATILCEEMARGYRIVLLSDRGRITGLPRRLRAQASLHACRHAGGALLENWLLHRKPPKGTWAMLHQVWIDAKARGLHQKTVTVDRGPTSVDELYKQFLLTEAMNPWCLAHGEVLKIHALLEQYAGKAELVPPGSPRASHAVFTLNTHTDAGPGLLVEDAAESDRNDLLLVTEGLSPGLNRFLKAHPTRNSDATTDADRIRQLITALGSTPQRNQPREPAKTNVEMIVGMRHIHQFLLERQPAGALPPYETVSRFQARDPKLDLSRNDEDVWRLIYTPDPARLNGDTAAGRFQTLATPEALDAPMADSASNRTRHHRGLEAFWSAINVSDGGYCLSAGAEHQSLVQVGELVILAETGDTGHSNWQTGVVRWLKRSESEGTQTGVQLLGRSPHPVYARTEQRAGRLSVPSRCLILPSIRELGQPVTLITPSLLYEAGARVRLVAGHGEGDMRLTRQVEGTTHYDRFELRRLEMDKPANARMPVYERLWSSL